MGIRRLRTRTESALATASDVARLRLGKMRSRYDLVDAALEAAELDRNRAGGLLAGGIAFRAFVWLLPMALVCTGVLGLVRDFSVEDPRPSRGRSGWPASSRTRWDRPARSRTPRRPS